MAAISVNSFLLVIQESEWFYSALGAHLVTNGTFRWDQKTKKSMLHLNKSYPTLELRPRTLRPDFWGPPEPYYAKKTERTRQNHILME